MNLDEACRIVGRRFFPRIRNPYGFLESLPNWDPVFEAFPGQNCLGDLDGIMERHGQFLVIEKKAPGFQVLPRSGQARTLKALHNLGVFTIIYLWGDEANPSEICVIWPTDEFRIEGKAATHADLIKVLKAWWNFAEQQKVH
jgi:hypothetical protein